jgi:Na+/melibiose symporter-like transporter
VTGPLGGAFRRLYASSATSNLADGVGKTALPLIAATFTRDPLAISALASFGFLPWLLFALPSGVLVDRIDRRYAMAAANAVRAASMGALAALVLTGHGGIVALYVAAFALGVAETVYDSATRALLPQVVPNDRLDSANGLLTVEETLGQTFLGGPVGSAFFALAVSLPLLFNASGFALAAVLVLTLRGRFRPARATAPATVRRDISDGVRWLAHHRLLRGLTLISATTALIQAMATGLLVLYVLEVVRLPSGDFGYVLLAGGIGALIGGLATPQLLRWFARGPVLTVGAVVAGVPALLMAFTRNGYVAAVLFAITAAGVMTWNVITMSLRQALIPHEMFGRVQGAYRTLVWGSIPVGSLAGGALAGAIGVRAVFAVSGGALVLCAVWLGALTRRHRAELAGDPDGSSAKQGHRIAAPHP